MRQPYKLSIKILILFFLLLLNSSFPQDSLLFVIRVDDIQSRNTTTLPNSLKQFQTAVELRGGKITWAVIPHRLIESQNQNGNLARELKESILSGHEIAMHGYNHICTKCGNSGHEMFCASQGYHHPYADQFNYISDGLKLLSDSIHVVPESFVPPGHYCDSTTFQVLLDKNFKFLSSTGITKNYIFKNLYNLQQNQEFTWSLTTAGYQQMLTSALTDVRTKSKSNGYYCILLHDPFIRQGYENGLVINWIGELMDSLNIEYGSKIKYRTLSEAANAFRSNQPNEIDSSPIFSSKNFNLYQNYPNPFNASTIIAFDLASVSKVSITVFDIMGLQVKQLATDQQFYAGKNIIKFDAGNLPTGIYFYKLETGLFTSIRKMILLK